MREKIVIRTVTREEYLDLMQLLEDQGYTWVTGCKPSSLDAWHNEYTCIYLGRGKSDMTHCPLSHFQKPDNYYTILTYVEYLERTQNLNHKLIKAIQWNLTRR